MPICTNCGHASEQPFRFCPSCGTEAAAGASREQRRTVTVVFCDLAGSTSLGESVDPERLRVLLARYFDRMKGIVESHGGTVEKFIGDAVMAVFGVPVVHEDDGLRAVRAAVEMRDALHDLGLEGRVGVMTGEVVTGTTERLVTGDAVNVAARLEQAAAPGEVLIGEPTLALVRAAVEVERIEPLTLKGKAELVPAHRLLAVREAPQRRHETPFVGRERELAVIRDAFARIRDERRCELITVVGEAGIGKSRLVAEALAAIDARPVRGRCLPYGDGITYWPVVEVLKQLDVLPSDETAAEAIRALLGESEEQTSADEIAWAFRKTLEHAAADHPLVVVLDDIQWGEQTFHDLIEHVALLSTGAPILLLCMARPELIEHRPTWPVTQRLVPLAATDVDALIGHHLPHDLQERIAQAAGGNPLFLTEMLAMAAAADGDVIVPPTLRALLEMRLDQLDPTERAVLERGAVEGEVFHRGAVQATAPSDTQVTPRLAALVRKELIRPDTPLVAGDDGFRFRHLLIRDTAYDALPKAMRAELHERFAAWLEQHGADLVELDEILGYHLERAVSLRDEIGLPVDDTLAVAASQHLKNAGLRALRRQDFAAAVRLLERARRLVPGAFDLVLETELGDALLWAGDLQGALDRAHALAERGAAAGDRVAELCGVIRAGVLHMQQDGSVLELESFVESVLPELEAAGDDIALYVAYAALLEIGDFHARYDVALAAVERAAIHATRAGHRSPWTITWQAYLRCFGTTSVASLIAWLDEMETRARGDLFLDAYRAWSLARLGQFDEARRIAASARRASADRGGGVLLANLTSFESAYIELLAGDPAAAADFATEGLRLHEALGSFFSKRAALSLATALYALERFDEATALTPRGQRESAGDAWAEASWRMLRGKLLARDGAYEAAEQLAREAVAMAVVTDGLDLQGDAYADLAEVLELGGRPDEARAALEQALDRYERKGNIVMAERTRARLAALEAETA